MSKFTKTGRVAKVYNCADCGEEFGQKSHHDKHKERKIPCILKDKPLKDIISETVAKEINKKFKETDKQINVNQIITNDNELVNNVSNSDDAQIKSTIINKTIYNCVKCGKVFGGKGDLNRHTQKKNPCIHIDNPKENPLINIIITKKEDLMIQKTAIEIEDITYENELKRIYNELKDDIYLYVFKNLEANAKFKNLYEDTISKIFQKFISICGRKLIKNGEKEEYKREFSLFDDKNKLISNDIIRNKLIEIFKDNEKYFNKRLLKYAKNVVAELYDIKYVEIED